MTEVLTSEHMVALRVLILEKHQSTSRSESRSKRIRCWYSLHDRRSMKPINRPQREGSTGRGPPAPLLSGFSCRRCVLSCGLRARQPLAQPVSLISPVEEAPGGRSVDRSMPPLSFSHPPARPLCGGAPEVCSGLSESVTGGQVVLQEHVRGSFRGACG